MRRLLVTAIVAAIPAIAAAQTNDPFYGMPPSVAKEAQQRCAKASDSFTVQDTCMQGEGKAYNKLKTPAESSTSSFDHEWEVQKARTRASSGYRDPNAQAWCGRGYVMHDPDGCWPSRARYPTYLTAAPR